MEVEEHSWGFPREANTKAAREGTLKRWWKQIQETRRFDPGPTHEPDYGRQLRESEGGDFNMGSYNEGGKDTSWQKWIMGIVSLCLVGMLSWALGKLDTLNQEVATLQATQTMGFAAIAQRQTADEQRIDRVEGRVYRGSP